MRGFGCKSGHLHVLLPFLATSVIRAVVITAISEPAAQDARSPVLNSISDPNRRESGIRRGGYENPSETHVS
jgi:hypothetical protein